MKTLLELTALIDEIDENDMIFAKKDASGEWTPMSLAQAIPRSGDREGAKKLGFEYFLEVFVAREVLEDSPACRSPAERCNLLIFYATNDCYPD